MTTTRRAARRAPGHACQGDACYAMSGTHAGGVAVTRSGDATASLRRLAIARPGHCSRRRLLGRRALAALALITTSALGLSACGGDTADGSGSAGGGTLRIAFWPDNPAFSCVDPFQTYWIEHRSVIRNVADSLTDQDPETGKITPWIAKSWEIAPDGLSYTFTLRDDATFSDGTKVDAAAVKANVDGWLQVVKDTGGATFGASYVQGLTGAEVVDPTTVELTFAQPNSAFLQATSTTNLALLSPASFTKTAEQRCLGDVVGSGPFVLDSYEPGEGIKLSKRDDYAWGSGLLANTGAAKIDEVDVSYVAEDSVRTGNLVSGAIDIAWPRNPFTVEDKALIESSGASVEERSLPGVASTLFPNTEAGHPLADPLVRQAFIKALDLPSYASTVYGDDYPVVGGAFDSTTPYFTDESAKLAHDPDGAGALLDQAGWTLDPESGYRQKDGKKLTIVYPVTVQSAGNELIQDQLKQVGIDLELEVVTAAENPDILSNGSYDLTSTYFTRANPGALQFILVPELANSKGLATRVATPDVAAKIKQLFATAQQTTDESVSEQAYRELQDLLIDEGVSIPLFERVQQVGLSSKVKGFSFTSESFLRLNDISLEG